MSNFIVRALNLGTRGLSACNILTIATVSSVYALITDLVQPLLPSVQIPTTILQDVIQIQNTASWQVIQLTVRQMLTEVWLFLLGSGSLFAWDQKKGPVARAVCICLAIAYYTAIGVLLYFLPTLIFAFCIVFVIYYNFGADITFLSASCISAYMTLSVAVKSLLCIAKSNVTAESEDEDAATLETYKDLLHVSEDCIQNLAETIPSSPFKDDERDDEQRSSEAYHSSPLRRALHWHLFIFKFYDMLLQSLLKSRKTDNFKEEADIAEDIAS